MIEKYYSGVIEQIYNRIGKETRNIVMANYSNDFSIENLEVIRRYQSNEDNVFLHTVSSLTIRWSELMSHFGHHMQYAQALYRRKL